MSALTDRQKLALSVLSKHGGKYPAAFVGAHLNPNARMGHLAATSTLIGLETRGLAKRSLSNTWSSGVYLWSITPKGRRAAKASGSTT